jgi:hypothetical protein
MAATAGCDTMPRATTTGARTTGGSRGSSARASAHGPRSEMTCGSGHRGRYGVHELGDARVSGGHGLGQLLLLLHGEAGCNRRRAARRRRQVGGNSRDECDVPDASVEPALRGAAIWVAMWRSSRMSSSPCCCAAANTGTGKVEQPDHHQCSLRVHDVGSGRLTLIVALVTPHAPRQAGRQAPSHSPMSRPTAERGRWEPRGYPGCADRECPARARTTRSCPRAWRGRRARG